VKLRVSMAENLEDECLRKGELCYLEILKGML